jgi:hypothetical protein
MKKLFIFFVLVLLAIQFIPSGKPVVKIENKMDLIKNNDLPPELASILKTSCYDCHSFEPKLPWYSNWAPVSWLVNRDVNKGIEEVNFSEWESLSKLKKAQKIDECIEVIQDGEMPLQIYTVMHKDAILSDAQKEAFVLWADQYAENLFEE